MCYEDKKHAAHFFLDPKDTHYAFLMRCSECTVNMSLVCVQLNTTRHLQEMLNTVHKW